MRPNQVAVKHWAASVATILALASTPLFAQDDSTSVQGSIYQGKLPRQGDNGEWDSGRAVALGRKWSGGTRPRLSWGRAVL